MFWAKSTPAKDIPQKPATNPLPSSESSTSSTLRPQKSTSLLPNASSPRQQKSPTSIGTYNHLCDVYIENSKSIIQDGTPAGQESAKQTLDTALEGGLTMIHPFMPFLIEELWQRLPRRPDDTCPSVVLAAYPQRNNEFHDSSSDEANEIILAISKAIRSLSAEYTIKESANVYIQLFTPQARSAYEAQLLSIKTLIGKAMLSSGALIQLLGANDAKPAAALHRRSMLMRLVTYLLVKGHVDIDAGFGKAKVRLAKANEDFFQAEKDNGGVGEGGANGGRSCGDG